MVKFKHQTLNQGRSISLLHDWVVGIAYLLAGALLSIVIGQDNNWDLRNYHIYNAYAYIFDRLEYDIIPAQIQSFFNPLPDVWSMLLYSSMRPVVAGAIMGAVHSLNYTLVYLISKSVLQFLPEMQFKLRRINLTFNASICALLISIAALFAPTSLSILGTDIHDNLISIPLLLSLFIIVSNMDDAGRVPGTKWIMAGLFAGFAFGLKMTASVYIGGMGISLLMITQGLGNKLKDSISFGMGVIFGSLTSGGGWFFRLSKAFGNPFFPWLNHLFRSPDVAQIAISDQRYLPQSLGDAFLYPFYFMYNSDYTYSLGSFRDIRLTLLYILGIYFITLSIKSVFRPTEGFVKLEKPARYILIFLAASYVLWLVQFGIYRYLFMVESLAFLGIGILILYLSSAHRNGVWLFVILITVTLIYGRFPRHDRLPWQPYPIVAEIPALDGLDSSIVILGGNRPSSFIVPGFPARTRFIRVGSNMHAYLDSNSSIIQRTREVLDHHLDRIYLISGELFYPMDQMQLEAFGLEIDTTKTWMIANPHEPPLSMWRIKRK